MKKRPDSKRSRPQKNRFRPLLAFSALTALAALAFSQLHRDTLSHSLFHATRSPSSDVIDTLCSNYLLLPREQAEELLKRLDLTGGDSADIARFQSLLSELAANPRIQGLDQWIRFAVVNHKQGMDLLNTFEELTEAHRQLDLLTGEEVIEVGADESQVDAPGKKSFDLLIRSKPGGSIVRAIEITTVQDPVVRSQDIRSAVAHGADKSRGDPRSAMADRREVSIALSLGCPKAAGGALSVTCSSPGVVSYVFPPGADGKLNVVTYDLLQDSIPTYLNSFKGAGALPLEVVTLIDRDTANLLAVYQKRADPAGNPRWFRTF